MKLLIAFFLFISLSSCLTVSFNQPQPKDGDRLQVFPEELRGTWTENDGDFFTIDAGGIGSSTLIYDSLENLIDTTYKYNALSDSLRMYQGGRYFIYNEQASDGTWIFAVTKVDAKGNIYNYICDDFKFYLNLNGLKADSASYHVQYYLDDIDEFRDFDTTIYNPSEKELSEIEVDDLQRVYFNGQIRIKDLRKIAIRKNLISIYWADGTAEEMKPDSEQEEEVIEN